ncbi:MAG: hypothetical protein IPP93_08550 [Chitinophagaceae bacterium]|nr:hypothetical protein [Chitinophagaceae bacterium]MBL0337503.1 hypothetical protein [Chitinophagaceae bacterium]
MFRQLFSNWNALRFFRLILGVTVIVQGIFTHDWMIGLFGVVFASMPLFNYGCCGVNGCAVPMAKKDAGKNQEVVYEEVVKK